MSGAANMTNSSSLKYVLYGLLLVALIAAPLVGAYPVFVAKLLCFALFASAFNLLLGYTGLLSFGHAAFFGGAGYVAGYMMRDLHVTPELGLLAGTAAGEPRHRGDQNEEEDDERGSRARAGPAEGPHDLSIVGGCGSVTPLETGLTVFVRAGSLGWRCGLRYLGRSRSRSYGIRWWSSGVVIDSAEQASDVQYGPGLGAPDTLFHHPEHLLHDVLSRGSSPGRDQRHRLG